VVVLLWWNPAERFKALCRQDDDQEIQFVPGKENERITFWAISICLILGIPMMMLAMENRNALFEIRNNNTEIKKSLTGTVITSNTIYNCGTGKNLYSNSQYRWLSQSIFDFKKNIICSSDYRETEIRFIDSPENAPIKINEAFEYLSISPDLQRIACLTRNQKISIFDLATKKIVKEFKGEYTDSLCWTTDSKKLFVVLNSNICELNVSDGEVKKLFPGAMPQVLPSGRISYRDNNKILVWNPASDEKIIARKDLPDNFRTYCFSPCEKYIAFVRQAVNTIRHPWAYIAVCKAYSNSRGEILHKISFCFDAHAIQWKNIDNKTLNMLTPLQPEKTKR
jgi:WD40 repeat protein